MVLVSILSLSLVVALPHTVACTTERSATNGKMLRKWSSCYRAGETLSSPSHFIWTWV